MIPSKEEMEAVIKELQKVLILQDWDIKLLLVDEYRMKCIMDVDHYDTIGSCRRYPNRKTAEIKLNVDHDRIETEWYPTLVHEMLHIHTCALDDIVQNITEGGSFERKHFFYESETLNCTLEKIIANLCPVTSIMKEVSANAIKKGKEQ